MTVTKAQTSQEFVEIRIYLPADLAEVLDALEAIREESESYGIKTLNEIKVVLNNEGGITASFPTSSTSTGGW
jgi:hypothetical protein